MEIINNSIINTNTHLQETIKKLQNEYEKGILDTCKHYQNIFTEFDKSLLEYFPVLNDMPSVLPEDIRFNPKIVIEFDNNRKASKILRDGYWNNDYGFIQNRKIMYEINLFQIYDDIIKEIAKEIKIYDITILQKLILYLRQHCKLNNNSNLLFIERIEEKAWKCKLKVDNYLNIESDIYINEHSTENIYFCFNKIPFPEIAFTTNKLLNDIIYSYDNSIINFKKINNSYDILLSRRNISIMHCKRENDILSKDNDNNVLEKCKYFIPDNYEEVYNYFEGFRKLANWHHGIVNVDKQRIKHLESECKLDKKKIEKLENEIKNKNEMIEKYKNLVN